MKTWRIASLLSVFLLGMVWLGSSAWAQDNSGLDAVLRGLEWNSSSKAVLSHFKKQKQEEFKEISAGERDTLKKETLRKRKMAEFERIEESFKKLSGSGRTGYEVSVIAGEFEKNNGESLLVAQDDYSQKYFLFADDKFWKLIIAYHSDYIQGIGFEAFIEQVSRKYGEPNETEYDREELARAVWRDEATELRIENKSEFFGTFTMVFSDLKTAERLKHVRKAYTKNPRDEASVSNLVDDIQEDDSFAVNDDIVDSITGDRTEVDLSRGMREDREMKRVGFEEKAADADADLPDEATKKAKKAKRRKAKPKAKPKKSKDLIIY